MKQAKRAIVMVVFVVTGGCANQSTPATAPAPAAELLPVYYTVDTQPLLEVFANDTYAVQNNIVFELQSGNHQQLLARLSAHQIRYFISHHNPVAPDQDAWVAPLVQDGIAIIVHPENPVENLSIEELQRIYRGFVTNWMEFGGQNEEIVLYSREDGAGLRYEFERLVMGQQQTSPNARVLSSSQLMIEQIQADSAGIGYIPISLLDEESKSLAIAGIQASVNSIEDSRYPLRSTIYVIGNEEADNNYRQFFVLIQNATEDMLSGLYVPLPR